MSLNDDGAMHTYKRGGTARRPGQHTRRVPAPRPLAPRAWFAEDSDIHHAAPPRPSPPRTGAERLQDGTRRWLDQLPEEMRPVALARLFPRIANKLCDLWTNPPACSRYMTSLLIDSRAGGRQGFPHAVVAELARLLGGVGMPVERTSIGRTASALGNGQE